LHTFEAFDSDQLDFIAGSNEGSLAMTDPIVHLLSYKEEPLLAWARDGGLLTVREGNGMPYAAQRYRAGVCIGASIMRTRIDDCAADGRPLPTMRVDPDRRYLGYPEEKTGDNFMRYYGEMLSSRLNTMYLEPAVERRYFAGRQSVADVYALERVWEQRGMDFLLQGRVSPEEMFGEVCRGMFHTFRLYRMLEREARLAPWEDTVYRRSLHRLVDPLSDQLTTAQPADGRPDTYRRWAGGIVATGQREGWLGRPLTFDYLGDTILVPGTQVTAVRRCLTGYVHPDAQQSDKQLHVAFRNSVEQYDVSPDDTLVVRSGSGAHTALPATERIREPGELVALCRGREAIMLSDLHGAPMNESLMHTLTMHLAPAAYV
jgi:hypothetical protein